MEARRDELKMMMHKKWKREKEVIERDNLRIDERNYYIDKRAEHIQHNSERKRRKDTEIENKK